MEGWATVMGRHDETEVLIGPIPSKLERILVPLLDPGEPVHVKLKGGFKEALICTDSRVIILKTGLNTGLMFGSNAWQSRYSAITSAEVHYHGISGYLELTAGGVAESRKTFVGKNSAEHAPNCVSLLARHDLNVWRKIASMILDRAEQARHPVASAAPAGDDLACAIERLWRLHNEGALSAEEFATAKARLIGG